MSGASDHEATAKRIIEKGNTRGALLGKVKLHDPINSLIDSSGQDGCLPQEPRKEKKGKTER